MRKSFESLQRHFTIAGFEKCSQNSENKVYIFGFLELLAMKVKNTTNERKWTLGPYLFVCYRWL